jgi:hypothetical protein
VEAWTDQESTATSFPPDGIIHRAEVEVRESGAEAPVRSGGELLGFAEAMGERFSGILELTDQALILHVGTGPGVGSDKRAGFGPGSLPEEGSETWPLLDIRAVQTSSSSLQFSPVSGGLVEFRFPHDSPFRWETLLRNTLRRAYVREELGEIVEFQPRIVAE